MTKKKLKGMVAGIGSVLMDILIREDDSFLEKTGAQKGGMTYVDPDVIDKILSLSSQPPVIVSGGSACNTIIGVGKLGGAARFVGKKGQDRMGDMFTEELKQHQVEPLLLTSSSPTGRVLSVITPDAQRTMFTFLGASAEAQASEISGRYFEGAAIVHVEGYLLFNTELIAAALKAAKNAGARISLDLASFTVVEHAKDFLDELAKEYVDILIANEDEARAFTGYADEEKALKILSEKSEISVLKIGARGSLVCCGGQILKISALQGAPVVDTTGAGDLWASGFLYGLAKGYSPEQAAELGSWCGYEVCRVMGAKIPEEGWERIRTRFSI
ncbi:MAG: adenosine kinase [Desulfococcaceae bacterium]